MERVVIMLLTQKNFFHKCLILIWIVVIIFLGSNFNTMLYAADNNKTRTIAIGIPNDKSVAFQSGMNETSKYFEYIRQEKALYKNKKFEESEAVLKEGLIYATEHKIYPWNLRWHLADLYEIMGKKEEFLLEINWLIDNCDNDQTKKKFVERRQKFLESHSKIPLAAKGSSV